MDEHIAYSITKALQLKGLDVLTIQKDKRMSISDQSLLATWSRTVYSRR